MSTAAASSKRWWWVVGTGVLLLALICAEGTAVEHLLLGWIYFPYRVVPKFTIDWPAAAIGFASLLGFISCLHFTLRWFAYAVTPAEHHPRHWPFRSTVTIALIILLMFTAGTAMVGIAHQSMWMILGRSNGKSGPLEPHVGFMDSAIARSMQQEEGRHLQDITFGFQSCHDVFQQLPPGGTMTEDGELLHGWGIFGLLSYINSEEIDFSIPWNKPPNDRLYKCNFQLFVNPAIRGPHFDSQGYGVAHVAANRHILPIRTIKISPNKPEDGFGESMRQLHVSNQSLTSEDIRDGASNTILLGTVAEQFKPWGYPANVRDPGRGINWHPDGFGGPPQWKGALFSFFDGHTQFVNAKADPRVLQQLATPAGGEQVTANDLPSR